MRKEKAQAFWAPGGATLRLPSRMRLARSEQERLWKGLERFANCGDSDGDYQALGRAFPEFWPVDIWHYLNQEPPGPAPVLGRRIVEEPELSEEEMLKEMEHKGQTESLNWRPSCRKLFLFFRDALRAVWTGEESEEWPGGGREEFLLGLKDFNEKAKSAGDAWLNLVRPVALDDAWQEILKEFPSAAVEGRVEISMLWRMGDFYLVPQNDFQRAFYLLFRQNWRARVCPRCKMFFVARKPKQIFCGTGCSAGSRLASKRKWWNHVGARRRAKQRQRVSMRSRRERKGR